MATLSDEEQQLIQRDREENPGAQCNSSSALVHLVRMRRCVCSAWWVLARAGCCALVLRLVRLLL